jgi:hypothetical protein
MEYRASYHTYIKFDSPYNLKDRSVVKEWNIKWDTLNITLVSGVQIILEGLVCKSDYPDCMYDENDEDIL